MASGRRVDFADDVRVVRMAQGDAELKVARDRGLFFERDVEGAFAWNTGSAS